MKCYEEELDNAIRSLKDRLRPGEASEVDICLAEAAFQRAENGNSRHHPGPDYLIALAGGSDVFEANSLQGKLSKIVDENVLVTFSQCYERKEDSENYFKTTEIHRMVE